MANSYWDKVLQSRISRRYALAASGATAFILACGGDDSPASSLQSADTAQVPGKVWDAANNWQLQDETKAAVRGGIYRSYMDEDQAGDYDAMFVAPSQVPFSGHVHEFLMSRNRGPGVDPASRESLNPVPALAQSWEFSPDGATVTFTLRPNVKWHNLAPVNGRVMDMEDWKSSAERFMAVSPQRVPLTDVLDKFEFPDATHMVWKMKHPYGALAARVWSERFAFPVMPKELNANVELARSRPIGTGYKILDKHQPAIMMEYRKNPDYWGGDPFIDRWSAPIIPEYANQYAQFIRGNITAFTPSAREVLQLARDLPQAVIVANPIPDDHISRIRFGRQNHKTLPWKDARVRVAIKRSIDMRSISEFLANKQQFEAGGIPVEIKPRSHLTGNVAWWLNPEKNELGPVSANLLFDAAEAKKLIEAAGFTTPIDIDWYTLPVGGQAPESDQLTIDRLQASRNFNVNVIRSQNTVAHRECRSLGRCDGLVQSSTSEDADHVIYRDFHSAGNTEGEQAYPDPRIDRIAELQRREMNPDKRVEYLKEFQRLAAELMPTIPDIHQYTQFSFRWPWLHNSHIGGSDIGEAAGIPEGRPVAGGHLQWLDANMPNRERGAS
jgi:peptide/nickel transport system substrate-binding protein